MTTVKLETGELVVPLRDLGPRTILSPHYDDAVLSAFHALTPVGWNARVVNVFTDVGDEPSIWDKLCGYDDPHELREARAAEDERVLTSLGVPEYEIGHLHYIEALHRDRDSNPSLAAASIAEDVRRVIPEDDTLFAPLGAGPKPNPDHVIVREAARALNRERSGDVILYADFPYAVKNRAWPPWVSGESEVWTGFDWWRRFPRAVPEMGIVEDGRVIEFDGPPLDLKRHSMEGYETQFKTLDRKLRTKGLVSDASLYKYEVYWRLEKP